MKKGVKKIGALLATLLIMWSSFLTSLANAVDLTKASVTFTMPDHDVNLVAISEANGYTVIFDGNWSTSGSMVSQNFTYDLSWTLAPNNYEKVWYTFLWWNTNSWANIAEHTDGKEIKNLVATWSITLYAIWSANTYQVKFNPNPGEDTLNEIVWTMSNQDFTFDTTWQLIENDYTRDWYTFLWWSRNESDTWATFTDKQSVSNLTTASWYIVNLYAIWSANTWVSYTVEHYKQNIWWSGWTLAGTDTLSWTTYESVTPAWKTYDWFVFSWTESKHIKWDWSTVFKYYYTRKTYTVTLHEGRWVASVSWGWTYYYDENVSVSATLKPWYTWLTWEWDQTTGIFKMPASNVEMTWKAIPITYTITYDVWSWTITWQKTSYNVEENFTLVDPTRTWYDFVWWSGTNLTSPTSWLVISGVYGDLSYEAVWSPRLDIYYYVHHMDEDILSATYTQRWATQTFTGTADTPLTLENLKIDVDWDCVTYAWWSLTESTSWLSDSISTTTILPDGTRHIYLYYIRNVYNVTLTRDENIASVTLNDESKINTVTKQIKCGATVEIDAAPKTWYHFLHWLDQSTPLLP